MTRETGDRAAFLGRIRRAVAAPTTGHARPVTPLPPSGPPVVAYATEPDFAAALEGLGGVVRSLADPVAFTTFVDDALDAAKGDKTRVRVLLTDEPECAAVAYALGQRTDVDLVAFTDAAAAATADIGFTGARAGVARTGSIVVDSGRAGGRTASLLPPMHVALLRADSVVRDPGDLWRPLGVPMPSNLVQITGPSRSADIELIITLGVHGPRALWVGLLV
ncbi:MAG TPA: LUD domain-containing protein [Acidimicrobiales bacterium]|nr:LUD domain-containing protein [Acidimicrobiales bacterium]